VHFLRFSAGGKIMNLEKRKNFSAIVIFSLLQLIYLFTHFSPFGCACAAIVIAYYFLRIFVGMSEKYQVSCWIGNYLGASFAGYLGMYVFHTGITYKDIRICVGAGTLTWAILLAITAIIILLSIQISGKSNIKFIVKYLLLGSSSIALSYIFVRWADWSLVFTTFVYIRCIVCAY
jgi:hypothetical protein